jgi:hypothetical protein
MASVVEVRLSVRARGDASRLIASIRNGGIFSLLLRDSSSSIDVRGRFDFGEFSGVISPSRESTADGEEVGDKDSSASLRFARLPNTVLAFRVTLRVDDIMR